jgi:hypothetical protein
LDCLKAFFRLIFTFIYFSFFRSRYANVIGVTNGSEEDFLYLKNRQENIGVMVFAYGARAHAR